MRVLALNKNFLNFQRLNYVKPTVSQKTIITNTPEPKQENLVDFAKYCRASLIALNIKNINHTKLQIKQRINQNETQFFLQRKLKEDSNYMITLLAKTTANPLQKGLHKDLLALTFCN